MPPRPRREDKVVIGLLGGSVATQVRPFLQSALNRWFDARKLPRQPVVLNLAMGGAQQPQQTLIVAHILLLGGEFDLLVNLDGVNEMLGSVGLNFRDGVFPFLPLWWNNRVGLTGEELLLAGQIGILRREQARLVAVRETSPLRGSALFGLANRWRQERTAVKIIQRNRQLTAAAAGYSLEKYGPRNWREEGEAFAAAARFWYRGSLALAELAELGGADYYHFLQPNQYVSDSKPLSREERAVAYKPAGISGVSVARGYPLMRRFNRDLPRQGVNYFDLTGVFADHPETLYIDDCCHLNDRGGELLAAAMTRRLEPALLHLGGESPAGPGSALAAARRPGETDSRAFQVSLQEDGKYLRYVLAGCAPADLEPAFFLHVIPQDLTDLPPWSREQGFANRPFRFPRAGGSRKGWQCTTQIRLPDYPIKEMRTGQHIPGQGDLWSVRLIAAPDFDQLRADYAALSAAEPIVRDYFELYELDNRLLYLRDILHCSCKSGNPA